MMLHNVTPSAADGQLGWEKNMTYKLVKCEHLHIREWKTCKVCTIYLFMCAKRLIKFIHCIKKIFSVWMLIEALFT